MPISHLVELNLGFNSLGEQCASILGQLLDGKLAESEKLPQSDSAELTISQTSAMQHNPNPNILSLSPLIQLKKIDLRANEIGTRGVELLGDGVRQLLQLNISNNNIKDEGARALAQLIQTQSKW